MTRAGLLLVGALLAGCLPQPRTPEPALYDLGMPHSEAAAAARAGAQPADIRVRVAAEGRIGARASAVALLRADSAEWVGGLHRCPGATRLEPAGPGWVFAAPGG